MENSAKRRWIVLVMAICLVALSVFALRGGETLSVSDDEAKGVVNGSVYIERMDGGSLFFGGEGTLAVQDVNRLLGEAGMKQGDVVSVVIGSGITEIGRNAFYRLEALKALYIGENVNTINHGVLVDCPSLEFVYLPKGRLRHLGKDFMYGSGGYVVTDGTIADLPKLKSVSKSHVLAEVNSYADLVERCGQVYNGSEAANGISLEIPEGVADWWNQTSDQAT